MSILKPSSKWPRWLIALRMPEFWDYRVIYFFVFLWLVFKVVFRAKGKFYPFALNRVIDESGGFSGADKGLIQEQFKNDLFPKTVYLKKESILNAKEKILDTLSYPFILKPTHLNRGVAVLKVSNENDLDRYLSQANFDFQAEEFLNHPMELAVFIANPPDAPLKILSLTGKEFLTVTGDGKKSIKDLLQSNWRYKMSREHIDPFWKNAWLKIPAKGKEILIQPIGNHNKGTRFIDESHKINPKMEAYFNSIVPDSLQYGRFDVKVNSWEDLRTGNNLKIIEFNGTIAEPVSYLDSKNSYITMQKIMFKHYKWQYKVAMQMLAKGAPAPPFFKGWKRMHDGRRFKNSLKNIRIE